MVEAIEIAQNVLEADEDDRGFRIQEISMASKSTHRGLGTIARLALLIVMASPVMPRPAAAQAPAAAKKASAQPGSVFDDDKTPDKAKAAPKTTDRDTIGFTQENVTAQMNELEERMFRLSEALLGLEPENASRLRLALKFSREEQILEQMRETHKLLKDAQLSKAETETKELIAKLEHLRNLLLAEDLDFQLKLARLRQMRETLGQVDRIVKEERRELGWSRFAVEQRKRLARLTTRRPDLEAVVHDQKALVAETKDSSKKGESPSKDALAAIRDREVKVRNAANALANDPLFADLQPPYVRRSDSRLGEAVAFLDAGDVEAAVAAEDKAFDLLRQELTRLDEQVKESERTIGEAEFRRRAGDQAKNRGSTENLEATSSRLGDVGVALRKDLIHAGASMQAAERGLEKAAAGSAAEEQLAALDVMVKSREDFARAVERLLVELRAELQIKLNGELSGMHETQMSVRETSQSQVQRVAQKSRTALITVAGLSRNEAEMAERTETMLALVEETEYGIALPTTLRILAREMRSIEGWLKAADVAPRTIALETRVEEDLLELIQAIRRLSPVTPPEPGSPLPTEGRARERELNRLVAELKMVRMLQARLTDDTVGVDKVRPSTASLPPAVRREIETLEATQDEIRDALAKISERLPVPDLSNQ